MLFKRQSFRFCEAIMTEIVTETHVAAVLNDPVKVLDKDEEFDKDSGNHSGEEVEMENGDDVTCEEKVACDLDKEGPHCHIDGKQTKSNPPSRKNSIAEELKAKIASVSRRNSFGSRRSSVTGSRRGSIQSIKEDPTCEEECGGQQPAGEHCHVDVVEDPTCANGDTCSDKQAEPHCHVDNASNGINNRNGDDAEKLNASNKDDPTCVEKKECPDTVQGDHCHVDKVDGQGHANDDDNDVITNVNDKSKDDRKQILQPNSPAGVVTMGLELAGTTAPPATRVSNDSTPQAPAAAATNMKETDSPAGVKEPTGSDSVPVRMPPTEHHSATSNTESVILPRDDVKMNNENTAINKSKPSEKMTASTDNVTTVPATVGATTTPVRARDRTRSKSRPSSPSSESRRSRFSSKERKSKFLLFEKIISYIKLEVHKEKEISGIDIKVKVIVILKDSVANNQCFTNSFESFQASNYLVIYHSVSSLCSSCPSLEL